MARPFRTFIAFALVAHLVATLALAAAPGWHEHVHPDAGEHEHECAITLFLSSSADAAGDAPLEIGGMLPVSGFPGFFPEEVRLPGRRGGTLRGRAPPRAGR